MKRLTNTITKLTLVILFMLILVACGKKSKAPMNFKLLEDDTYEVVSFNKEYLQEEVIIPEVYNKKPVTSIGSVAFSGAKEITSVVIPSSIITIKQEAFSGTDLLSSVTFKENSQLTLIGDRAFYGATNLAEINLPDTVEEIGSFAFGLTGLTAFTFPNKVTYIPSNLFSGVETLKTITITINVETINKDAFANLPNLESIEVESGNQKYSSEQGVLYNKDKSELIIYPEAKTGLSFTVPSSVATIKQKAFKNVNSLKNITISNSVTTIESYAFEGTKLLESVIVPNSVTTFGESVFKDAVGLLTVTLPNNLTSLPYMTFYGATKLATVNMPNTLEYIESYAFSHTKNLSLNSLPSNLKEIGSYAFYSSEKISKLTIPASVEKIDNAALSNMKGLKTIEFEENNNLKVIGNKAFADNEGIKSLEIPETVEMIGESAFTGLNNLTSLSIPFIGSTENAKGNNAQFAYIFGTTQFDDSYDVVYFGSLSIKYYVPNKLKEVIILGGTEVKANAFDGVKNIETLILPEQLTTISSSAFKNMGSLKELVIPNSVGTIAKGALNGTNKLENLVIPFVGGSLDSNKETRQFGYIFGEDRFTGSYEIDYYKFNEDKSFYLPESLKEVTVLGGDILDYAFSGANKIEYINIPNNLETLGNYAFNGMTDLKEIVLPENLISFGKDLLAGAKALKEITIPNTIKVIEEGFLKDAISLEHIIIPDGVEVIGKNAFDGALEIKELIIPESVNEIQAYAFKGLSNLLTIEIPETVTKIGEGAFNTTSQLVIFVEETEKPSAWHNNWNNSNRPVYFGITEETLIEKDGVLYVVVDDYLIIARFIGDQEDIIIEAIDDMIVKEIGNFAFFNSDKLLSILLPETLEYIGLSAFNGAAKLQVINIPNSVEVIGNTAFNGTTNLVTYVEAEEKGTGWHDRWIPAGRPIHFGVGLDDIIVIDNTHYVINGNEAILTRHLGGIDSLVIPEKINGYNLETISGSAFTDIEELYSVYIPETIKNIGLAAFHLVDSLIIYAEAEKAQPGWENRWNISNRPIYYNANNETLIEKDGAQYILVEDHLILTGYFGSDTTFTVPRKVNDKDVTEIKVDAFSGLNNLKALFILDNIEKADAGILKNSPNVVVYVEHANKPTGWNNNWNSDQNVVHFNVSEESLIVTEDAHYIVGSNDQLTLARYIGEEQSFVIPSNVSDKDVKTIAKQAFIGANTLEYVIVHDGVSRAEEDAFSIGLNLVIYIELEVLPFGWNAKWNEAKVEFYLKNDWKIENGIPVVIE